MSKSRSMTNPDRPLKPDRLTKLVEQRAGYAQTFHPTSLVLHKEKVLALLRREQRAQRARVVKIVEQQTRWALEKYGCLTTQPDGTWISRAKLLAAMDGRKKL